MKLVNSSAYQGHNFVQLSKADTEVDIIVEYAEGNNASYYDEEHNEEMIIVRLVEDSCEDAISVDTLRALLSVSLVKD